MKIAEVVVKEVERKGKQKGKESDNSTNVISERNGPWCDSHCITVSISNERLRNESSSKFLEWWQRQVKNGMVKADGLALDEEKRNALDQLRKGAWGAVEGMEENSNDKLQVDDSASSASNLEMQIDQVASSSLGGLISSSLLGKLQAARSMREQQQQQQQEELKQKLETIPSEEEKSSNASRRSLVLLDGSETFQSFLQDLPRGFAIVEYFHIEVWERKDLLKQIEQGKVIQERLNGKPEKEEEEERLSLDEKKHPRSEEEAASSPSQPAKKAKVPEQKNSMNALNGLTAYASSEEEGEGDEENASESEGADEGGEELYSAPSSGGLARMAQSLGMVPLS
ncbi:hypothetical protein CBS101457_005812 [Exobasidium rhododendri]|nr:hypothetical protein CBS101457_005812 [Exobasidium rhododendri]